MIFSDSYVKNSAPPAATTFGRSRFAAQLTGILTSAVGGFALIGWCANNEMLKSIIPGASAMRPNMAAGFLLCG
ncbi:MAG: hypothetical protein QOG48_867, partial [Verrucomicrobiota bacterium]